MNEPLPSRYTNLSERRFLTYAVLALFAVLILLAVSSAV